MKSSSVILTLALTLFIPTQPRADEPDAQYVAELLSAAQSAKQPYPDILKINPALTDAFLYDVQKRFIELAQKRGATIGGYKGGFIPRASAGGVLFEDGILRGSPTVDRADFSGLLIEAEIGFQLCEPRNKVFMNVEELKSATCAVFPAIELPDAALADLAALKSDFARLRRVLIPINIAASHLIVGEPQPPAGLDLDRLDIRVALDNAQIGFRDGAAAEDDIWSRVLWIVNHYVIAGGYPLSAEHVIIPGALTGLHPGIPGHYSANYGELGAIDFDVR